MFVPMLSGGQKAFASSGRQPLVVDAVAAVGVDVALQHLHVVHRVREHHHAARREHDVVVQLLRQVLPQLHGVVVERGALVEEVVGADDRRVAAGVAAADPALLEHRDVREPVLGGEVIRRAEAMPAAADDDRVVGGLRLRAPPLLAASRGGRRRLCHSSESGPGLPLHRARPQALRSLFSGSYGESTSTVAFLRSPRISICKPRADRGERRLHVADREALPQHVAVVAGGGAADQRALPSNIGSLPSGSASVTPCTSSVTKRLRHAGGELLRERLPADELALVHAHEAIEAGLERRVVARQVAAPHAVGLLHAQRLHRAHADHADAELRAGGEERVEQVVRVLDREMQLPAELADEIDAQRVDVGREPDFDRPGRSATGRSRCRAACR